MSTILDALKKSEQERKLKDVPQLSDMPVPQERSRWPMVVMLILLVLCIATIIWLVLAITLGGDGEKAAVFTSPGAGVASELEYEPDDSRFDSGDSIITVEIISYSQDPAQRFAIINGKMLREGEFLRAGVKVETIDQDNVTLNDRGDVVNRHP